MREREKSVLCRKEKAATPTCVDVTASVDTVSLLFFPANYGLNLIFLVVTSAAMGNPSWIFSFSISP